MIRILDLLVKYNVWFSSVDYKDSFDTTEMIQEFSEKSKTILKENLKATKDRLVEKLDIDQVKVLHIWLGLEVTPSNQP